MEKNLAIQKYMGKNGKTIKHYIYIYNYFFNFLYGDRIIIYFYLKVKKNNLYQYN